MESPSIPTIIPCINGEELNINSDLVNSCLSAISVKVSRGEEESEPIDTTVGLQHRNSYINLHRPEITRIHNAPHSQRKIAIFLHKHATKHGSFCAKLHNVTDDDTDEPHEPGHLRCLLEPRGPKYPDHELMLPESSARSVKDRLMQMTDEDLDPGEILHRSRALFCVLLRNITMPSEHDGKNDHVNNLALSRVHDDLPSNAAADMSDDLVEQSVMEHNPHLACAENSIR